MHEHYITLNDDCKIPQLGLGVWKMKNDSEVETAVATAIETGYRLIDTAAAYGNEPGVGRAVKNSSVPRSELFITTKLWNADQGYESALKAFDDSLKRLQMEYVDLYLIHWPAPAKDKYVDSWKALIALRDEGRVRSIGVSNFTPEHLDRIIHETGVVPVVNQIELHPKFNQAETRIYCKSRDIAVESWSPLGGSGGEILQDASLLQIAEKYQKSVAQIIIRWHIQLGLIVIPKSSHPDRIRQNFAVFDFELSDEDMERIRSLDSNMRVGPDPATANFT